MTEIGSNRVHALIDGFPGEFVEELWGIFHSYEGGHVEVGDVHDGDLLAGGHSFSVSH